MRERPILFSGPMVRAILDGRKTQTRRVIAYPRTGAFQMIELQDGSWWPCVSDGDGDAIEPVNERGEQELMSCPYGVSGDRLWVRESIQREHLFGAGVEYLADHSIHPDANWAWPERESLPSIFMPRGLSRITLEVTEVRVQRVQEISPEDAVAEGAADDGRGPMIKSEEFGRTMPCEVYQYAVLWDSINGKRPGCAWADNPWVWAITFRIAK